MILVLITLAVPLSLVVVYHIMRIGIFIAEEINHSVRKAKKDFKADMRSIAWALKHL